jgi:hypothetical protein
MKFRIEHGATPGSTLGIAVIFEMEDIPKLETAIHALKDSGRKVGPPARYEPLYAKHGIDPETMYPADDLRQRRGEGEA